MEITITQVFRINNVIHLLIINNVRPLRTLVLNINRPHIDNYVIAIS